MARRLPRSLVAASVLLAQAALAAACVDGVTPDCADAAAQCGPSLDAAREADTSVTLPDATPDAAVDGSGDAAEADAPDADLDGGDGG